MKLKKAIKVAGAEGFNYVAIDRDGAIYAYKDEPELHGPLWGVIDFGPFLFLGYHSGKKDWRKTLREVQ